MPSPSNWKPALLCLLAACASAPPATPPPTKVLPLKVIDEYAQATAPEIYLRTTQDVLPGGLAAAMAPVLVDWDQSDPLAEDGHYVLRNLNDGGNPLAGTTVLRSARIPARGIERAEFILVPLDPMGTQGVVAHGMLRFVFAEANPGHLLNPLGEEMGSGAELHDLVLSWEAWRAPGVDFDFVKGMDPKTFGLSLRAYSGPQRFLEDALGKRDWHAYTLRLPGGRAGIEELLYDSLVLGDGTGRHVLADVFARGIEAWLQEAPDDDDDPAALRARYDAILESVHAFEEPGDERLRLEEEDRNYQTMLRSCATMALYCVNVATERLLQRGVEAQGGIRPTAPAVMADVAPWMKRMSHMKAVEIFLVAPEAVRYLVDNVTVIPTKIPGELKAAGLLADEKGKAVHYSLKTLTPYGDPKSGLIR